MSAEPKKEAADQKKTEDVEVTQTQFSPWKPGRRHSGQGSLGNRRLAT
jgi:hypothetical protein